MTRQRTEASVRDAEGGAARVLTPLPASAAPSPRLGTVSTRPTDVLGDQAGHGDVYGGMPDLQLLRAASTLCQDAALRGERLSQRALARQLRERGHRFPTEHLRLIASSIGLAQGNAA